MSTVLLLITRAVLALVFATAAVAKLTDLAGSVRAVRGFGVGERLSRPLGTALPCAELLVALGCVPGATAQAAAAGAILLLLLFMVAIARAMAAGRAPDCHCFGQLHSSPAGAGTLVRNGALALIALPVLLQPRHESLFSWADHLTAVATVALVGGLLFAGVLALLAHIIFALLRRNGRLLERIDLLERQREAVGGTPPAPAPRPDAGPEGLPIGAPAPDFAVSSPTGGMLTLAQLRESGRPLMLVFSDVGCGPCNAMLPALGNWQREREQELTIAIISRGELEANRSKIAEHDLAAVGLQIDWEVATAYGVRGTPSAVLISPDGRIAGRVAGGAPAIEELVATAGQPPALPVHHADGAPVAQERVLVPGDALPPLELATTTGPLRLDSLRGRQVLMLFWNQSCGFCRRMQPELRTWAETRSEEDPQLILVSGRSLSLDDVGFPATVVLDRQSALGRMLGSAGTPSAVLVDADGHVASEMALGAEAVLALAQRGADVRAQFLSVSARPSSH